MHDGQGVVVGAQLFEVYCIDLLLNVVQGLVGFNIVGLGTLVDILRHLLGQVGVPKMSGRLPEELLSSWDTDGIAVEAQEVEQGLDEAVVLDDLPLSHV